MRSLCVVPSPSPWPLRGGWSIRQWNVLLGLRSIGDVDVWMMKEDDEARAATLGRELGARVHAGVLGIKPWTRWSELRWMTLSRGPKSLDRLDFGPARQQFRQWMSDDYDVAVYTDPICHAAFGTLVDAPAIVDLDDVPDLMARREFRVDQQQLGLRRVLPRQTLRSARGRIEIRRWRRFQADLSVHAVWRLVCSDDDRRHLGSDHVAVVPNVYERTGPPRGRLDVSSPPTILLQGWFDHRPNADAVAYLATELLPRIRQLIPGTGLLVAGPIGAQAAASLSGLEGVRVLGFVPHIEDALEMADLVAVPLRLGGGTRIKILEAFAHRIPVVSTSIGAEGLNVEASRELLLADDADDFVRACVRALQDRALREQLTEAAFRLVQTEYAAVDMQRNFASLVQAVAAGSAVLPRPDRPRPRNGLQFGA